MPEWGGRVEIKKLTYFPAFISHCKVGGVPQYGVGHDSQEHDWGLASCGVFVAQGGGVGAPHHEMWRQCLSNNQAHNSAVNATII